MKWIKASERFPDDWEHKHLRYSFDHYVVEGSLFEHRDDALCKIGGTGRLEYHQFEWLDESEPPAPAGEESMSDFLNSKGEDDYELYEEDAKNDTKIIEAVREENSALQKQIEELTEESRRDNERFVELKVAYEELQSSQAGAVDVVGLLEWMRKEGYKPISTNKGDLVGWNTPGGSIIIPSKNIIQLFINQSNIK
jgi:hypothetical protein